MALGKNITWKKGSNITSCKILAVGKNIKWRKGGGDGNLFRGLKSRLKQIGVGNNIKL